MKTEKKKPKFLRRDWYKKSKLGRNRKNKQVWRKPKGRHIKTRLKFKGKSKQPSIGYSADKESRGRLNGLKPIVINNVKELEQLRGMSGIAIIVAKSVGMLKRAEIAKKAIELKMKISNMNSEQLLEKIRNLQEKKKEKQKKETDKKKESEEKKVQKTEEGENKK